MCVHEVIGLGLNVWYGTGEVRVVEIHISGPQ
jgi:hypothetical protein